MSKLCLGGRWRLLAYGVAIPEANWAVEIVRIMATGGIALFGAWIGFGLANRGRKYDLLYKERFSSFKQFCDQTLHMKYYAQAILDEARYLHGLMSADSPPTIHSTKMSDYGAEIKKIVDLLGVSQGSMVLINNETRQSYEKIMHSVELFTNLLWKFVYDNAYTTGMKSGNVSPEDNIMMLASLMEASESTVILIEESIDKAYKSLQLPDYAPIYGTRD